MLGKSQDVTGSVLALAVLSALLISARPALAQTEKVLYSFGSQSLDGQDPVAGLVFGKKGNLYGTTEGGGFYDAGTVFEIATTGKEAGTEKVLYNFGSHLGEGSYPHAGLIFDKEGNLYGTTWQGGAYGVGTVFEITSAGTEEVLYSFGSQSGDGAYPLAGLVFDKKGHLYGTTENGGAYGYGTVYKLTPAQTETVLYSFGSQSDDGSYPNAGLVFDKKGNLYGTTWQGGAYGQGTVFEITSAGTEEVLHSFGGQSGDGADPSWAGLVFDKKGNLYGVTGDGGAYDEGTVFEVTPAGIETVLYSFGSQAGDGAGPAAGLIIDKEGNLYGTTSSNSGSGCYYDGFPCGTVFKVTSAGEESVLYSFCSQPYCADGAKPQREPDHG